MTWNGTMQQGLVPCDVSSTLTMLRLRVPAGVAATLSSIPPPADPETQANRGYCFLNFIDPSFAWMFKMSYEGKKMAKFNSNKVVSVTPATLQGFEANYAHYSSARVNRGDPAARPLFLRETRATRLARAASALRDPARGAGRKGGRGGSGRIGLQDGFSKTTFGDVDDHGYWASASSATGTYFGLNSALSAEAVPRRQDGQQGPAPQSEASQQMVPKFCPHCGGSIQAAFQFCPQCGNELDFSMVARREDD
ncbi:unnamed protein product [Prorocentrum cordatum]|uniref:Zinc-ribbon domain-containing protein n=1 Tax=Prorocentrum cordatum TaxID=2364126 RepID=A0ABN9UNR1_9DINO|nr:unnamed protein product [Polarella glacialis]